MLVRYSNSLHTSFDTDYDILVTNPPYSGEHKPRLIEFLKRSEKPFLLLLPVYTATKSYWRLFAEEPISNLKPSSEGAGFSSSQSFRRNTIYLLPPDSYEYHHPEGTGKDIPPFFSAWFAAGFSRAIVDRYHVKGFINITFNTFQ